METSTTREDLFQYSKSLNEGIRADMCFYTPKEVLRALLDNRTVKRWHEYVRNDLYPESKSFAIFLPCSRHKPYTIDKVRSRSYKALYDILERNDWWRLFAIHTVSVPLGVITFYDYDRMPLYDCFGLYKEWTEKFGLEWDQQAYTESVEIISQTVSEYLLRARNSFQRFVGLFPKGSLDGRILKRAAEKIHLDIEFPMERFECIYSPGAVSFMEEHLSGICNRRFIVLVSGGPDSIFSMFLLTKMGYQVQPLFIDYGSSANAKELETAKFFSDIAGRQLVVAEVDFGWLRKQRRNLSLDIIGRLRNLPLRNLFLIEVAAIYALGNSCEGVFFGVIRDDTYPDNRPSFLSVLTLLLSQVLSMDFKVASVFQDWYKSEVFEFARELGLPFERTYSCYGSDNCGKCEKCQEKKAAVERLGELPKLSPRLKSLKILGAILGVMRSGDSLDDILWKTKLGFIDVFSGIILGQQTGVIKKVGSAYRPKVLLDKPCIGIETPYLSPQESSFYAQRLGSNPWYQTVLSKLYLDGDFVQLMKTTEMTCDSLLSTLLQLREIGIVSFKWDRFYDSYSRKFVLLPDEVRALGKLPHTPSLFEISDIRPSNELYLSQIQRV